MNRIVKSWQRYQERTRKQTYGGPDTVVFDDGEKIQVLEDTKMLREVRLPENQFNNIIRFIKRADIERIKMLFVATQKTLDRLNIKSSWRRAVKGVPVGSDQGDLGSIFTWLDKIQISDIDAVEQVVAIDATASKRLAG